MEPTDATYGELRLAYDTINLQLFDGMLPPRLLTLQREKRTNDYFSSKRFGNRRGERADEIALNPEYFAVVPLLETLRTIAHEMVHLWQFTSARPDAPVITNAEWADKMADYVIPCGSAAAAASEHQAKPNRGHMSLGLRGAPA